ncbi:MULTISPECIES: molybdate ABC transporter substrate-binding protein [unclassified Microbacterium]|uniref:molybdate ABC transporter substrate-binding protein n=1 Tax=unclassified Microbacterium TaxID=2609290 RepID=UPI0012FBAF8F|nr:molybdate ABC transporter substrate-binding protein [Microbacterium sp. MAH-37]MVQ43782.1 molybdate ABC transporter substrate-binding protein [Microbacterium sp. MAH-37]
MHRTGVLAAAVTAVLLLAGCSGSPVAEPTATQTEDSLSGDLTVYAAASLSGAFDELAKEFSAAHPGVTVKPISYDGSSVLATQLIGGAPADVFASADEKNMAKVTDAGLAEEPVDFAANVMQIATAPGNPKGITDLASLTAKGLTVVLCAPEVPCGAASQTLLKNAGVTLAPASEEQNVTAVLTKVASGEADAGLVYVTDVEAAGDAVTGIPIDGADAATNVYPIAALKDAPNADAAAAFVAFVTSPEGRAVLEEFGFEAP